jgi:regulator of sigma E protease
MSGLGPLQTPIAFVLSFGLLVFFHELGHFSTAKLTGVKVREFALGVGRAIWKIRKGETVYSIRLIPLGGFVLLAGVDDAPSADDDEPLDPKRDFTKKPVWAKLATIIAGPFMNFVLAALLFTVVFGIIGVPVVRIAQISENSPAQRAGLMKNDVIVGIEGRNANSLDDVISVVNRSSGKHVELTVRRAGELKTIDVVPQYDDEAKVGRLGVSLGQSMKRQGFIAAIRQGLNFTVSATKSLVAGLSDMITGKTKAEVTGPIGIFSMVGSSAKLGILNLLFLIAVLSINLGVINLLPIPILDGGWVMFILLETIMRRPLKPEQKGMAQFLGMAVLLFLFLFASYGDVARLDIVGRLRESFQRWFL